jgi:hypothetical protein
MINTQLQLQSPDRNSAVFSADKKMTMKAGIVDLIDRVITNFNDAELIS